MNRRQQLFKIDYDLHILIMNVEAFSTKKGLEFATKFLSCHKTLMAVDESTTIKTPTAKRTKSILLLGSYAKYRRIHRWHRHAVLGTFRPAASSS